MVKSWQIMEKLLPIKGESPLSAADVNLGCCLPFTLLLQMCGELEMKRVWHFIIIFLCLLFSFKEKRERKCASSLWVTKLLDEQLNLWICTANAWAMSTEQHQHVMWWQNVIATAKYKSWTIFLTKNKITWGLFSSHHCYFRPVNLVFVDEKLIRRFIFHNKILIFSLKYVRNPKS